MKLEIIEEGTVYDTNYYGEVIVLKDLGRINKKHLVRIMFKNSESIQDVELYELKRGNIRDHSMSRRLNYDKNEVYQSNHYGQYSIIEDLGETGKLRLVKIRFLDTGYENIVAYSNAKVGNVKDIFRPSVYGVGYIGTNDDLYGIDKILYHRWINMLSRCYNINDKRYGCYGAIGVTVDPRWFNYNQYRNDVKNMKCYDLFAKNPELYHLDKDSLQFNIPHEYRVYSPNTCLWINASDNVKLKNTRSMCNIVDK